MLRDLYNTAITDSVGGDLSRPNWDILTDINNTGVAFESYLDARKGFAWRIEESVGGEVAFKLVRDKMTMNRFTDADKYGLLGLSEINVSDRRVVLTEGVSDFFTARYLCGGNNVLGVTTLSGSKAAKAILVNMFDEFIICSDNDAKAERNTGLTNSSRFRSFLEGYGKKVSVFIPADGYKDITDNFIGLLKNGRRGRELQR